MVEAAPSSRVDRKNEFIISIHPWLHRAGHH
jgi:hypothetical protein